MLMARYKTLFVMLLTLVFTGQALASTIMSCQSQSPEAVSAVNMSDHSQHMSMEKSLVDTEINSECCASDGCSFGGCTVTAVLPLAQPFLLAGLRSSSGQYYNLALNQRVSSLFRPPISA